MLIWITGLAGSGKTTIGKEVYARAKAINPSTVFLDGDHYREIIGENLGYSREERLKVAMQIARMCKYLVDQEINVVCSTISLFKEVQDFNRKNIKHYKEIYIYCTMEELVRRDQKGIYSNKVKNVVGVDIAFDEPVNCDLKVENSNKNNLLEKVRSILEIAHIN